MIKHDHLLELNAVICAKEKNYKISEIENRYQLRDFSRHSIFVLKEKRTTKIKRSGFEFGTTIGLSLYHTLIKITIILRIYSFFNEYQCIMD